MRELSSTGAFSFPAALPFRSRQTQQLFASFMTAALLITVLCLVFEPRWETNDDVAMSMVAHGYGIVKSSSPKLIFSNVVWGYIVHALPAIHGILGYSLGTLCCLLIIGWATLYFLLQLGTPYGTGLLIITLLLARPILYPQFTLNAGFLTLTAILGLHVYAVGGRRLQLALTCIIAFIGYLVRSREFFLVLAIALPLLPWSALRARREMRRALLLLALAIGMAATLDYWAYSGSEWQPFSALNPARTPFTDFGAAALIKQHPDILARHGYTPNDIDLIYYWFFIDPRIANPASLNALLTELGPLALQEGSVASGIAGIKILSTFILLPLSLTAALLFLIGPRKSTAASWILCVAVLFAMGLMGRPGVLRVCVPLIGMLLIASVLPGARQSGAKQWMMTAVLFIAAVANGYLVITDAIATRKTVKHVQRDMLKLPRETLIVWGGRLPYEEAYPLLGSRFDPYSLRIYSLGGFTLTPFSVAVAEQSAGRGMLERLHEGVPLIALPLETALLATYCKEHLHGIFHETITLQTSSMTLRNVQCQTTATP